MNPPLPAPPAAPAPLNTAEVRPHPAGGYTLAVPLPGADTARVYVGRFDSFRAAARFLAAIPADQLLGMAHVNHRHAPHLAAA